MIILIPHNAVTFLHNRKSGLETKDDHPAKEIGMGLQTLFCEPLIWLFGIGAICAGGGDISTFVFLPTIGVDFVDITQHQAHHLMVFVGIASVVSRLVIGIAFKLLRPLTIWNLGCGGAAVCSALFPFLPSYELLVAAASFQGLFMSAYISTQALSALELFGIDKVNTVTGVLHFLTGIGAIVTPPVVGHLFETAAPDHFYLPSVAIGCVYLSGLFFGSLTYIINFIRNRSAPGCAVTFDFKRGSIVSLPASGAIHRRDSTLLLTGVTSQLK